MRQKYHFKLFLFDLDGTALGGYEPYVRLPDHFCRFLDSLSAKGISWGIISTWRCIGQYNLIMESPVKSRPLVLAGAERYLGEIRNEELILDHPWNIKMQRYLAEIFPILMEKLPELIRYLKDNLNEDNSRDGWPTEVAYRDHILTISTRPEDMGKVTEIAHSFFKGDGRFKISSTGKPDSISVVPKRIGKGILIEAIKEYYGIKTEELLIAGDEYGDLTMMDRARARYLVCPENAIKEVKQAVLKADGVVGRQKYSDGVLDAIEKLSNKADG